MVINYNVYTTSYRSQAYIRRLFLSYGIWLDKVINKRIHDKTLGEKAGNISKYPPLFNIDVHIDDSQGVALEGEQHYFNTIIVAEQDNDWTKTLLHQLSNVKRQ